MSLTAHSPIQPDALSRFAVAVMPVRRVAWLLKGYVMNKRMHLGQEEEI